MKNKYKVLIIAILVLAILMSAISVIFASGHHCHHGERCTICTFASDIAKAILSVCIIGLLAVIVQPLAFLVQKRLNLSSENTLIRLKVKLSD